MNASIPSSLDADSLARRLCELVGEERKVQVEFLLHLDEFDRRRAFLDLGFGSLWDYCLKALHLREGAAGRRIGAMRVLRRFPKLAPALRDGRLCLSTLVLLGQVLTAENADALVARAAYRTKAEVDHLVASVQGIRKLTEPSGVRETPAREVPLEAGSLDPASTPAAKESATSLTMVAVEPSRARTGEVRAVSEGMWSLRATIDRACKDDLEALAMLLSHKLPGGDLSAVLHEAIRCGLDKHGKRKGAVKPARPRAPKAEPAGNPASIPAAVRRQAWERDGSRCTWEGTDGRRCDSRWQVEVDHVRPPSLGGTSEPENLRLLCRRHNILHAEQIYGREFMKRFRKDVRTISGDSAAARP